MPEATRFDTPPEISLESIGAFGGPVLVDLDETLYLRNSTEDFIDCAAPAIVALTLLKALDVAKPWRFTGGEPSRDVWRVRTVRTFNPWLLSRWKRRVHALGRQFVNVPLLTVMQARDDPPIITTMGFQPIVKPLIAALGLPNARIISCRIDTRDRCEGKLNLIERELGRAMVTKSLVLTDSMDDLTLLQACARPLRTIWPGARYHRALDRAYVPGRYLTTVKRPGERYIWRGILQEDYVVWLLSSVPLAADKICFSLGLLLLIASFWAIYESGYVDNDRIAERHERQPKLNAAYFVRAVGTSAWQPWIWGMALGLAGLALLRLPHTPSVADLMGWFGILIFTELWFRLYNRVDKSTRTWLYAVLQLLRSAAFIVVAPITVIGAAAISANVLSRWVPYYAYRLAINRWSTNFSPLIRLIFLAVIGLLLTVALGPSVILNLPAGLLLIWCVYRARHDMVSMARQVKRLDKAELPGEA
jgi:hypothetical protein